MCFFITNVLMCPTVSHEKSQSFQPPPPHTPVIQASCTDEGGVNQRLTSGTIMTELVSSALLWGLSVSSHTNMLTHKAAHGARGCPLGVEPNHQKGESRGAVKGRALSSLPLIRLHTPLPVTHRYSLNEQSQQARRLRTQSSEELQKSGLAEISRPLGCLRMKASYENQQKQND